MACVPDPQPQQGGGGMSPMQGYQMYQQFGGAGAGGSAAGFAPEYGAISPGIAAGADTGAGITTASGVTGGGGTATGGSSALAAAGPWAAVAAVWYGAGKAIGNDNSTYLRWVQSKDLIDSWDTLESKTGNIGEKLQYKPLIHAFDKIGGDKLSRWLKDIF